MMVYTTIDRGRVTGLTAVIRCRAFRRTIGILWSAAGTNCRGMTRGSGTSCWTCASLLSNCASLLVRWTGSGKSKFPCVRICSILVSRLAGTGRSFRTHQFWYTHPSMFLFSEIRIPFGSYDRWSRTADSKNNSPGNSRGNSNGGIRRSSSMRDSRGNTDSTIVNTRNHSYCNTRNCGRMGRSSKLSPSRKMSSRDSSSEDLRSAGDTMFPLPILCTPRSHHTRWWNHPIPRRNNPRCSSRHSPRWRVACSNRKAGWRQR